MRFEIKNIEPMGAVRTTQKQKFVDERAKRYFDYKKVIYYEVLQQLKGVYNPIDGAAMMSITFKMPIPKSWPVYAKKEAVGQYCTTKPDIDNLVKGLLDALNGLLWVDDNRIVGISVTKIYDNEPGIDFSIMPIGGLSHGQAKASEKESKTKQAAKRKAESRAGRDIRARI